jgi:aminopeptidase N
MEWWTDLWLNEGFAEWAQFFGSNATFPEWDILDAYFYELEHVLAFRADESFLTHAVREDIHDPRMLGMLFDDICKIPFYFII